MTFFSHLENSNPFLIPLIIATTVSVLHYIHRIQNKPGRLRRVFHSIPLSPYHTHVLVLLISLIAFLGAMMFEYYYHVKQCSVSQAYFDENLRLFAQVTTALTQAGIIWWMDMATLLCVLRKEPVMAWDHDTDISIIHPNSIPHFIALESELGESITYPTISLQGIMDLLKQHGIDAYFIPSRQLLQARWSSNSFGPHTDIWVWDITKDTPTTSYLTTPEPSIWYARRKYLDIFPLQHVMYQDMNVSIPQNSREVSVLEYSHYGGDVFVAQWFRKDCLHNWWQGRYRYG